MASLRRFAASWTSRKPPPPRLPACGSVTALLEDGQSDLAGQGLLGDHQALAGVDRMDAVAGVGEREFGSPRAGPPQEQQGDPAGEEPGQRADGRGPRGQHENLQRWGERGRG